MSSVRDSLFEQWERFSLEQCVGVRVVACQAALHVYANNPLSTSTVHGSGAYRLQRRDTNILLVKRYILLVKRYILLVKRYILLVKRYILLVKHAHGRRRQEEWFPPTAEDATCDWFSSPWSQAAKTGAPHAAWFSGGTTAPALR